MLLALPQGWVPLGFGHHCPKGALRLGQSVKEWPDHAPYSSLCLLMVPGWAVARLLGPVC